MRCSWASISATATAVVVLPTPPLRLMKLSTETTISGIKTGWINLGVERAKMLAVAIRPC